MYLYRNAYVFSWDCVLEVKSLDQRYLHLNIYTYSQINLPKKPNLDIHYLQQHSAIQN